MEKSGPTPIEDRAANKEKMAKKKSKPEKSQFKTDSNPNITRIEDEIANFVVQWESLSGESANEGHSASSADPERTNPSNPDDQEDQEVGAAVAQVELVAGKGNHRRQLRNRRMTATTAPLVPRKVRTAPLAWLRLGEEFFRIQIRVVIRIRIRTIYTQSNS